MQPNRSHEGPECRVIDAQIQCQAKVEKGILRTSNRSSSVRAATIPTGILPASIHDSPPRHALRCNASLVMGCTCWYQQLLYVVVVVCAVRHTARRRELAPGQSKSVRLPL